MQQFEENQNNNNGLDVEQAFQPNRERTRKNTVYIFGSERLVLLWRIAKPKLQRLNNVNGDLDPEDIYVEECEQANLM